jgi:hypothetical protein
MIKGSKLSEDARKKISEAHKGRKNSKEHNENIRRARIGTKRTKETCEKLRLINIGRKHSKETKQKISKGNMGKIVSDETRRKMSIAGKKYICSNKTREKLRKAGLGKKQSEESRKKRSISMLERRERHWNWRGGINKINIKIRKSLELKLWREAIFIRDNWTCLLWLKRGVKLNADHIKPFALFPELRFELSNGRTLCPPCHRKTPTYGNKKHATTP